MEDFEMGDMLFKRIAKENAQKVAKNMFDPLVSKWMQRTMRYKPETRAKIFKSFDAEHTMPEMY